MGKLDRYNKHRKFIASYYVKELRNSGFKLPNFSRGAVWLRFPVKVSFSEDLLLFAKAHSILLGDWYRNPVTPARDLKEIGYKKGSCPIAEEMGLRVVNLPTYPTFSTSDAKLVIARLKEWQKSL